MVSQELIMARYVHFWQLGIFIPRPEEYFLVFSKILLPYTLLISNQLFLAHLNF